MKTRVAAVLSVAGVLIAGSAAALVNTQVLSADAGSPAEAAPVSTSAGSAPSTTTSAAVTVPAVPTSPPTTAPPATAAPPTQAAYAVGDAGTVTLDVAGDVLTIVSVTPNPGWTVHKAENDGPLQVEVKFRSATSEVEFKASLLFGVVTTSVEVDDLGSATSGPSPSASSPTSIDDHGGDRDRDDNSGSGSNHGGRGSGDDSDDD